MPDAELRRWADRLDPAAIRRGGGRQRLARALEIVLLTGRPLDWWHRSAPATAPAVRATIFVLDLPRDELYSRIDERVTAMAAAGLEAEVRGLVQAGYSATDPGLNATGYIELLPYIAGEYGIEEALERVRRATRRYARRQLTWFRNQLPPGAHWLDATRSVAERTAVVLDVWNREGAV
jgi:tRNA dimethylallyltransferase